ncbi:hypothetical protein Tsubulata_039670 [Turnera subulata]|uniref:DUF4283 domain-containing protein n=1 Tax=Turnera subulata TaxID=218843 RepID=A0A9Q0FAR5_9ROSI|nr:hypothetical protein Tsubulata_039670 [Turnera subulata]
MLQFIQQQHDWIPLWFASFKPWENGDRAVNRRCWVEVRGLPLHVWSQECFELIGSAFGSLVRVHSMTEHRQNLSAANLEIITDHGGIIVKALELKVLGQSYNVEVVEGHGKGDLDDSSLSTTVTNSVQYHQEETDGPLPDSDDSAVKGNQSMLNKEVQNSTRSVTGSSSKASPTPTYNPYTPLAVNEDDDDVDGPPGFVPPGFVPMHPVTPLRNVHSPASSLSSHSTSYNPTDPNYIQFLEDRLANAICQARVSTRKKFKGVNTHGNTASAVSSYSSVSRRVHSWLNQSQVETRTVTEVNKAETADIIPEEEARQTVVLGDELRWDRSENSNHATTMAIQLIEKEKHEWSKSKADV